MSTSTNYESCGHIKGSKGAINALIFSKDAKFLFTGGDDGCLRIYNTKTLTCEQVLQNEKWGQVTALTFIHVETQDEHPASICVGTGRGSLYLYPRSKISMWFVQKEALISTPFSFNDPVEAQAYDGLNRRLAVASHSGQVKLFDVRNCVELTPIWNMAMENAIPRSLIFFGGANQSLLVHGLETGEMTCRSVQTAELLWTKTLAGGIGNTALSPDEMILLVDNLSTGKFDIYNFPASTPSSSFDLSSSRHFTKQCTFGEAGKIAICGSDHGKVYVMDLANSECLQSLHVGQNVDLVQTVAAATTDGEGYFIAAGTSAAVPVIRLWRKMLPQVAPIAPSIPTPPPSRSGSTKQALLNVFFTVVITILAYPHLAPLLQKTMGGLSIGQDWRRAGEAAVTDVPKGSFQPDLPTVVVPIASQGVSSLTLPATTVTITVVAPVVSEGMGMRAHADSVKHTAPKKQSAHTPVVDPPNVILL